MTRFAICDDERIIANQIASFLHQELKATEFTVEIYQDGLTLLKAIKLGRTYDIIFLDIKMTKMDGIAVGKKLYAQENRPIIIFISSYDDQVEEMFEVQPYRFLRKPFKYDKFQEYLAGALKKLADEKAYFHYKKGRAVETVLYREIIYFESDAHVIKIIMTDDRKEEFYGKLDDIVQTVPGDRFILIHKSILINTEHIVQGSYDHLILSNGDQKLISRSRRGVLRSKLADLQERM